MNALVAAPKASPIGLYFHIPFCKARCRFCGFYLETHAQALMERLIAAELRELEAVPAGTVSTAYVGGGSPSVLPIHLLARLIEELYARQPGIRELTLECSPEQVSRDSLGLLRQLGVTRLSIGAQSFIDEELAWMGRTHRAAHIGEAVAAARHVGFDNIGLDLIFALPGSTATTWQRSLDAACRLEPTHVSTYSLAIEPNTALAAQLASGSVRPLEEEADRAQYEQAIAVLEAAGIRQYEISNFARAGYRCRHNLGFWHNRPYIGIGPSAWSYWQGRRTGNIADLEAYLRAIESNESPLGDSMVPNGETYACETAVLNLRTRGGIHTKRFYRTTGYDIMRVFAEPIERYLALGLLAQERDRLFLTPEALPIADSVLCDFAAP